MVDSRFEVVSHSDGAPGSVSLDLERSIFNLLRKNGAYSILQVYDDASVDLAISALLKTLHGRIVIFAFTIIITEFIYRVAQNNVTYGQNAIF